jgi:hypothetical protein
MNAVTESAGTTLLKALINEVQQLQKPWQQLTEREQEVVIFRLRQAVESSVRSLVNRIAAADFPSIPAVADSVTFKDGIKAALTVKDEEGALRIAKARGTSVMVVIASADQLLQGIERVKGEVDQADMFHEEQSESEDPRAQMSVDSLREKLDQLRVYVGGDVAAQWTEQERVVAWEWALAFEEHGDDCTIARPHWLPIPEPIVGNDANGSPTSEDPADTAPIVESEAA